MGFGKLFLDQVKNQLSPPNGFTKSNMLLMEVDKYKARFVARGFSQREGIDDEQTFALTTRYTTIRYLISLATTMAWNIHQMDVKTTFLNGTIDEEVYIEKQKDLK